MGLWLTIISFFSYRPVSSVTAIIWEYCIDLIKITNTEARKDKMVLIYVCAVLAYFKHWHDIIKIQKPIKQA